MLRRRPRHKARPKYRNNPLRGEWWIQDGSAIFADGDVGDMNHEGYARDFVVRQLLDFMDIDVEDEYAGELRDHKKEIIAWLENEGVEWDASEISWDDAAMTYLWQISKSNWANQKHFTDAWETAQGSNDAREYGLKYLNWQRVHGNNIQTWKMDESTMRSISGGISDIMNQDDDEGQEELFNIEVMSNRTFYEEVPLSVIESKDPGALRIYGTRY
jgi:hypothetical protein